MISFFCRLIQMEGDGFLTDILLNQDHGGFAGGMEDNLNIPITQGITSEGQQAHVEVQPSRNTKGSKRKKNLIGRKTKLYALVG